MLPPITTNTDLTTDSSDDFLNLPPRFVAVGTSFSADVSGPGPDPGTITWSIKGDRGGVIVGDFSFTGQGSTSCTVAIDADAPLGDYLLIATKDSDPTDQSMFLFTVVTNTTQDVVTTTPFPRFFSNNGFDSVLPAKGNVLYQDSRGKQYALYKSGQLIPSYIYSAIFIQGR